MAGAFLHVKRPSLGRWSDMKAWSEQLPKLDVATSSPVARSSGHCWNSTTDYAGVPLVEPGDHHDPKGDDDQRR